MVTKTFFTSDLHFGHKSIIEFENRPFDSVEEMDEELIERWNYKVGLADEVYIIGDFSFSKPSRTTEILKRLNGRKYLIRGNHDHKTPTDQFEWVKDYFVLVRNKIKFVLFHYPIQVWDGQHHNSVHCYGHVHSNTGTFHPMKYEIPNSYNVGADVNGLAPIELDEILINLNYEKVK